MRIKRVVIPPLEVCRASVDRLLNVIPEEMREEIIKLENAVTIAPDISPSSSPNQGNMIPSNI